MSHLTSRTIDCVIFVVCFSLCYLTPLQAQVSFTTDGAVNASKPTVSANGMSSVTIFPETIWVVVPLQCTGKTMDDALAKMKTEQNSAIEKLVKIGFKKDGVKLENFGVDQAQENKRRQMEIMLQQRIRGNSYPVVTSNSVQQEVPQTSITLKTILLAEKALTATTQEELLKESETLKQKITAADFSPKKEELTPEEEELAEEMEGMSDHYHHSDDSKTITEPHLIYAAKLSDEKKQAAYKEAFEQAKSQAETLVKLTSFRLGMLWQLSGNHRADSSGHMQYHNQEDYRLMQMMSQISDAIISQQTEGIALTPAPIVFNVSVQTVFAIEVLPRVHMELE